MMAYGKFNFPKPMIDCTSIPHSTIFSPYRVKSGTLGFASSCIAMMLSLSVGITVLPAQPLNLLGTTYSAEFFRNHIANRKNWHPFPKASERAAWNRLPGALRKAYLERGEQALTYQWPVLSADLYLEYSRTGSRRNYDRLHHERRQKIQDLVLAECFERKGRFLRKIIEGIQLLGEEPTWVVPAHLGALQSNPAVPDISHPVVDLYCGETANLLAWTYYLIGEELLSVSPLLPEQIRREVTTRLLTPAMERDDFWWMLTPGKEHPDHAINNWTSWICSNWLVTVLLVEDDDAARLRSLNRIVAILDRFVNSYPDDGGVDEGPNYWNHSVGSLYETLLLLGSATGMKSPLLSNPLIREMGRYIYRTHVADDYFVTISDSPVKIPFPSSLAVLFGHDIEDENLSSLGGALAIRQDIFNTGIRGSMTRQLLFLFNTDLIQKQPAKQPLLRDVWLPHTQFFAARERANSSAGFYLAAQGLHNGKSHNHNDVGNFLLYLDGRPLILDVGPEGYNAKTFTAGRYDIWTMQSAFHNLPTINGMMQKGGKLFAARDVQYHAGEDSAVLSLDIAGAYPSEARVKKWVRRLSLDRKRGVVSLQEDYVLGEPVKDLTMTLMTSGHVLRSGSDYLVLSVSTNDERDQPVEVEIGFEPSKVSPQIETIQIKDEELREEWGESVRRILFRVNNPGLDGTLTFSFKKK
jgi:hypothetical protein